MSTSTTTGFCRVTVVAPDSRIDVALPEDIPLADVYPEVLRLSGQGFSKGAPVGFHLVRRDGTVLDSSLTLIAQQVRDGDLLSLRPFAESLPPAVYDDVADAIATAVAADRSLWTTNLLRTTGLIGCVLMTVLLGFALWFSRPHPQHALPARAGLRRGRGAADRRRRGPRPDLRRPRLRAGARPRGPAARADRRLRDHRARPRPGSRPGPVPGRLRRRAGRVGTDDRADAGR